MKRLLERLECPILHLVDDIDNLASQASLIGWLEDRKIRQYDVQNRLPLRQVSQTWPTAVSAYLTELGAPLCVWEVQVGPRCPIQNKRSLQWLAQLAVSIELEDKQSADEVNEDGDIASPVINDVQNGDRTAELGEMVDDSDELAVSVTTDLIALERIGESLSLRRKENELIADYLERVFDRIRILQLDCERLQRPDHSLPDLPLGFTTQDANVDRIALVLRTMHLRDLRTLQTDLNDLTVLAQAHTARPRMDAAQGKVGR